MMKGAADVFCSHAAGGAAAEPKRRIGMTARRGGTAKRRNGGNKLRFVYPAVQPLTKNGCDKPLSYLTPSVFRPIYTLHYFLYSR